MGSSLNPLPCLLILLLFGSCPFHLAADTGGERVGVHTSPETEDRGQIERERECPYSSALFAFGGSFSDTGNGPRSNNPFVIESSAPPYGKTFFKRPACRYSDGRLIVDCIGQSLGLGFQNPFLLFNSANFSNGVNYAVSGCTAIDATSYVLEYGLIPLTPQSLKVQVDWHLLLHKKIIAGDVDPSRFPTLDALKKGLYFLEFGGVDIALALSGGVSLQKVKSTLLPMVVKEIYQAVKTLYNHDARNFVIADSGAEGCTPALIAQNSNDTDRDERGCLNRYNDADREYTKLLKTKIETMKKRFPEAHITFVSFYDASIEIFNNQNSDFANRKFVPCCLPPPNNSIATCNINSPLCSDPNEYVQWDVFHFTDNFARQIVNSFLQGRHISPENAFSKCKPTLLARASPEAPAQTINCSPGLF